MYTEEAEVGFASLVLIEGRPFLPLDGCSSVLLVLDGLVGMTDGSSNWPAGVNSRPPSGLNVSRRKKLVKLSSPYSFTDAQDAAGDGKLRIAGKAGIGEGERPKRP